MRVPQLKHTDLRGIGWHVSYRDKVTGLPRRYRFGRVSEDEAKVQYKEWLAGWLMGEPPTPKTKQPIPVRTTSVTLPGEAKSLAGVVARLLSVEYSRVRRGDGPRVSGTIDPIVYVDRSKHAKDFLQFLDERHGHGATTRMTLADLQMEDIEAYNDWLVTPKHDAEGNVTFPGYSASQVQKRMQIVKRIIDRAGRPEHGQQVLLWNWTSRDRKSGRPPKERKLPTVDQIRQLLAASTPRERCIIWLAIGLGFGQRDIAAIRVGCIDAISYDLRRGKTGIERYGSTPPLVWAMIQRYLKHTPRPHGSLMFTTKRGNPVVHGRNDAILQWWDSLRSSLGLQDELEGFYILRHLGATEFGSRKGTSIGEMKRWLGHSVSSEVADVYMKPVSPEKRAVVEWVRARLFDPRWSRDGIK